MSLFASCQQTYSFFNTLYNENKNLNIITSLPPFNKRDETKNFNKTLPNEFINYNIAVYGVKIPLIIKRIFENEKIRKNLFIFGDKKDLLNLNYTIDRFVQTKTYKINKLVSILKENKEVKKSFLKYQLENEMRNMKETECILGVHCDYKKYDELEKILNIINNDYLQDCVSDCECNCIGITECMSNCEFEQLLNTYMYYDSIDKLEKFGEEFKNLKETEIKSWNDWNDFILKSIRFNPYYDWKDKLNLEVVLTLFGFDEATCKVINDIEIENSVGVKVGNEYVRWISKMLSGYNIKGCLTDVINFIFAILEKDNNKIYNEKQIVNILEEFEKTYLEDKLETKLSIGTLFVDMEKDDLLTILLAYSLFNKESKESKGDKLNLFCQLPYDFKNKNLLKLLETLKENFNVTIIYDLNSLNSKVLENFYGE